MKLLRLGTDPAHCTFPIQTEVYLLMVQPVNTAAKYLEATLIEAEVDGTLHNSRSNIFHLPHAHFVPIVGVGKRGVY